ncbi:hypothetical protein LCGC14_1826940 [marine sediment metagenome]|uniref:Uncharacterized protein n=1 Tax=marine sediment metagenome TaxID=412755 RepID=A0A0F9H5C4_9ZZZZ
MTPEEIKIHKERIDDMTQEEMAQLWRFAPAGHPYFDKSLPFWEHFDNRFKGFTPELSKRIGL